MVQESRRTIVSCSARQDPATFESYPPLRPLQRPNPTQSCQPRQYQYVLLSNDEDVPWLPGLSVRLGGRLLNPGSEPMQMPDEGSKRMTLPDPRVLVKFNPRGPLNYVIPSRCF